MSERVPAWRVLEDAVDVVRGASVVEKAVDMAAIASHDFSNPLSLRCTRCDAGMKDLCARPVACRKALDDGGPPSPQL